MSRQRNPKDLVKEFKRVTSSKNENETNTTTLIAKPEFVPAKSTSDGGQPNRVYDDDFSRLAVTLRWKSSNGGQVDVTANVKVDKLAGIYHKACSASHIDAERSTETYKWTTGALQQIMSLLSRNAEPSGKKQAETGTDAEAEEKLNKQRELALKRAQGTTILSGKLKGLTPYQAALEGKTEMLNNQANWLNEKSEENVKYKKSNDVQVNAIKAALWLVEKGLLQGQETGAAVPASVGAPPQGDTIILLKAEPKGQERQIDRKTGFAPCHEISIVWHIGNNYPVEVKILNYDAPVRRDSSNRPNVIKSERRKKANGEFDDKTVSFRLDEHSFWDCVRLVKTHMARFGYLYSYDQITDADTCERQNIWFNNELKKENGLVKRLYDQAGVRFMSKEDMTKAAMRDLYDTQNITFKADHEGNEYLAYVNGRVSSAIRIRDGFTINGPDVLTLQAA